MLLNVNIIGYVILVDGKPFSKLRSLCAAHEDAAKKSTIERIVIIMT